MNRFDGIKDFGMPTLIENKNLEETASLCAELGLSFVELNMNFPDYQSEKLEDIQYFMNMAEKYNIYFTIHLDENFNISDFNRLVADAYMKTAARTIEAAGKLHAPVINMHMNHGIYLTLPDKRVQLFKEYNKEYIHYFKEFRKMCEEMCGDSIKICVENTDGFKDYEKEAVCLLLESDVFALTWDIGHSHVCGNIDEEFIKENAEKLCHFHIHDAAGKKNHLTLGSGEINLAERLQTASENKCRCVIETKTVESLKQSVQWLRNNKYM